MSININKRETDTKNIKILEERTKTAVNRKERKEGRKRERDTNGDGKTRSFSDVSVTNNSDCELHSCLSVLTSSANIS